MHVLFLPSWYPTNSNDIRGSFFREQALAIANTVCKVGVIAPELRSLRRPIAALKSSHGIHRENDGSIVTLRAFSPNLTPRLLSLNTWRIRHLTRHLYDAYTAQEGRPDLIHVHSALPAGVGALDIKRRLGVPFVLSEHSSAYARQLVGREGRALSRNIALEASERYAVSTQFAGLLDEALKMPTQSFSIMPNMVDGAFLKHAITPRTLGHFNFLHISTLDKNKNVPALLQAFAKKYHGRADVSLTIAGDGPARAALEQLAKKLGIFNEVSFLGRLSRSGVITALSTCDAFVLPSRYETFGVVLVEALAMGVPVIATRCGGPEDIVTDANGLLVPVDDVDSLAMAMKRLHDSRTHYDPALIRENCRARFGPEAVSKKWHDIYTRVAADKFLTH